MRLGHAIVITTLVITGALVQSQAPVPEVTLPPSPRGTAAIQVGGSWTVAAYDGVTRAARGSPLTTDVRSCADGRTSSGRARRTASSSTPTRRSGQWCLLYYAAHHAGSTRDRWLDDRRRRYTMCSSI